MSKPTTAKELFEDHLSLLMGLAKKKNMLYCTVLESNIKNESIHDDIKNGRLGFRYISKDVMDNYVERLIEIYRLEFYEGWIGAKLQNDAVIFTPGMGWFAAPEESMKKWEKGLRTTRLQNKNLAAGREIGAKVQKDKAAEAERVILQINDELLKHPDTSRWGLKERASHIEKTLKAQNIKQPNGKPYAFSTIKLKITGT